MTSKKSPIECFADPIFTDPEAAREYLEAQRWPDGPYCPHCGATENMKRLEGKSHRPGLFACNQCRGHFSVTVGTVYERSHVPLHKWLLAVHLLTSSRKGMSAHQLHRTLGVTYKTAWFMAHRIRESMKDTSGEPMGGKGKVVEADETYLGTPEYRFHRAQGWKPKTGSQKKAIALVERGGEARALKVDDLTQKSVREFVVRNADRDSVLSTDEAGYFKPVGREFKRHWTVNHSIGQYGRGMAHSNTIEGYWSIFKRGMKGIYQHCGEQHLQRYLDEFSFRYSNRHVTDGERRDEALKGITGKRLTYRTNGSAPF